MLSDQKLAVRRKLVVFLGVNSMLMRFDELQNCLKTDLIHYTSLIYERIGSFTLLVGLLALAAFILI